MGTEVAYVTKRKTRLYAITPAIWLFPTVFTGGCAGNARVELTVADSVEMLGASMTQTLAEYHADLARFDEERQRDTLVVVGSMHLLGAGGLVAELRAGGYSVDRIQ